MGAAQNILTNLLTTSIVGIDRYPKQLLGEAKIRTFEGSQDDAASLNVVIEEVGRPEIIDDGSHLNAHVIKTFDILSPQLSDRGF